MSRHRKTVSLICSLCVCNGHPPMQAACPCLIWCAVTQNQALNEVSAYIIWYRVHTLGLQGKGHKSFSVHLELCIFTNNIHVNVKNSSAEGTC